MSKLAIYKDNCSLKVGDLGNVSAGEDGRASFRLTDRLIKVLQPFFWGHFSQKCSSLSFPQT